MYCGVVAFIALVLLVIYFYADFFMTVGIIIASIIVSIVLILIISVIYERIKFRKYKKKFSDLNIEYEDYYLRIKLDVQKEILYFFRTKGTNLIEIPFDKIFEIKIDSSGKYSFKTTLDDKKLRFIKNSFQSNHLESVENMLYYITARNKGAIGYNEFSNFCNILETSRLANEIEEAEELRRSQMTTEEILLEENNKKLDELIKTQKQEKMENNEELRRIIEEQNKRIEELEKNQKNSNDSDKE